MAATLDHSLCKELAVLVEKLTTTGQQTLDEGNMKRLKSICKKSDDYVKYAHSQIMMQLEKDHAEIRFSAFQIVNELFCRSHHFRTLMLSDFQTYMELTMETNPDFPLPPPKAAAKDLKTKALEAMNIWNQKYGREYKKLSLGYDYLKGCKKLDFVGINVRTAAQQRTAEEQQRRQEIMRNQRLENCMKEMADTSPDIKDVLVQIENALQLILPNPESFQIHGLMSPEYSTAYHNPFSSYARRTSESVGSSKSLTTSKKSGNAALVKNRRWSKTSAQPASSSNLSLKKEKSSNRVIEKPSNDISTECETTAIKSECETTAMKSECVTDEERVNCGPSGLSVAKKAFNQTNPEVKQVNCGPSGLSVANTDFNQTNPEVKQVNCGPSGLSVANTDFNQTNPEVKQVNCGPSGLSVTNTDFNQTNLEVKQVNCGLSGLSVANTDQTNLEVKQVNCGPSCLSVANTDQTNLEVKQVNCGPSCLSVANTDQTNLEIKGESTDDPLPPPPTTPTGLGEGSTWKEKEGMEQGQDKDENERNGSERDDDASDDEEDFQEISTGSSESGEEEEEEVMSEAEMVRQHGLGSHDYQLSISFDGGEYRLEETPDNTDILQALRDLVRQLSNKMMPKVQRWLEVLSKAGAEQYQIKRAIDIKNAIEMAKTRAGKLKIIPMGKNRKGSTESVKTDQGNDGDDDDSDFEEVPEKEGYEPHIPAHLREENGLLEKPPKPSTSKDWSLTQKPDRPEEIYDPTTPHATLQRLKELKTHATNSEKPVEKNKDDKKQIKSEVKKIKSEVPVIPFGTDLLHWGDEKMELPLVVTYESEHKFWNAKFDGEDVVDKIALESMKSRVINFTGKFEPVTWSCRAPLRNGTLCPRRDRFKCPFHGKVIPRDNMGQPSKAEDRLRLAEEEIKKRQEGLAEWEDPQLQAEIEAATGVNLNPGNSQRKGKGRGKSKVKYPGLTNLNQKKDVARSRLEKKILNPQALKRVAHALDNIASKKLKDKFGNSFNYTHSK